ncbi:kinetochore protein spc24-like [Eriocheir sinensis]|uniref:kinetochore protein spc24-like n=1 Tax=Eriocheir sinensis TaxID=95602 RepID=UPI0021C5D020|nr:kinetochore protein spc24-like [Eriocheir sinensis]
MERENKDKHIQEMNNTVISVRNRLRNNTSISSLRERTARLADEKSSIKRIQEELQESIRELLSLAKAEASSLQSMSSQSVDSEKKNLTSELTKIEKQKEELERELAGVGRTITHKKEVLENLQNQAASSQQETSTCLSKIRASYALYTKLSNIKWDHNAPEGIIKGFVMKPEESRVIPYKFEKGSHSQFFITNYIWEQINAGQDDLLEEATPSA